MTRKTSEFPIATQLPAMFIGRDVQGNKQIPLAIVQGYIQEVIASTASNAGGAVNFRGVWNANYAYAPNDIVSYNNKVYLMIGPAVYMGERPPDLDAVYWLSLFGQMSIAVDMDDLPNMGFFYSQGARNAPGSDPNGYGFTIRNGTGYATQVFWNTDGTTMYVRTRKDNRWFSWFTMAETFEKITYYTSDSGLNGLVYIDCSITKSHCVTITKNTNVAVAGFSSVPNQKTQRARVEIVNGGAFDFSFVPDGGVVRYIKNDGTTTTDMGDLGITFNAEGSNFFDFWTRDSGANVYAVAVTS